MDGSNQEQPSVPAQSSGAVTPTSEHAAIPEYVRRYLDGESVQAIAPDYRISVRTLYRWIFSELGDGYHDSVTQVLVARVADADIALDAASDAWQIARAREQARFARMDLERRRPHLYGQRPQVQVNAGDGVNVQIVQYGAPPRVEKDVSDLDVHTGNDR